MSRWHTANSLIKVYKLVILLDFEYLCITKCKKYMKLADIIDTFITGDWGEESPTQDTPNAAIVLGAQT